MYKLTSKSSAMLVKPRTKAEQRTAADCTIVKPKYCQTQCWLLCYVIYFCHIVKYICHNVRYTILLSKLFNMSHKLLLSNKYKMIGWIIFFPSFILGLCLIISGYEPSWLNAKMFSVFPSQIFGNSKYFSMISVNLTNTIVGILFIVGCLLVGFTKEKNEDEFIAKIRLSSLLWAVFVNYTLLLIAFIFIYDTAFLSVMIYNMFTVLLIFILRFNYILYKNSKSVSDEK